MKTTVSFGFTEQTSWNIGENALPKTILDSLKNDWPGKSNDCSVSVDGAFNDEAIQEAIRRVARIGKIPKLKYFPGFGKNYDGPHFRIRGKRVYDRTDAEAFVYFIFYPTDELANEEIYRLPDGTREKYIDGKKIFKRHSFGFAGPFNWACKSSARAELEAERFVGLTFDEMPQKPVSKPYEPIFRLVSSLTLPPVLNPLYNEDGELCHGDFSRGCVPDNSIISGLPFYYGQAAIRAMEPFDCAWSAEAFGGIHWRNRSFVVSKRFLEYCWSRGWHCDFVPVILRPDGVAPPLEPLFPWLENATS